MKAPGAEPFSKTELFQEYIAFYEAAWLEGKLCICNRASLKEKAKECLGSESWTCEGGLQVVDFYSIAEECLKTREEPAQNGLKSLMKAFEVLELICVNLFLSPWRKEIRTLKTFTGNFVYFIQSVLPENTLKNVLRKIGYIPTKATEFSVVENINEQKTKETAFEIFLARNEFEVILGRANDEENFSFLDILQQRSRMYWRNDGNEHKKNPPLQEEPLTVASGKDKMMPSRSRTHSPLSKTQLPLETTGVNKEEHLSQFSPTRGLLPLIPTYQTTDGYQGNEHQAIASCHFHGKCSDSEEFVNTYSDIIIAQKPIFQEDLTLKKFKKQPQNKAKNLSEVTALKELIAEANAARPCFFGPSSSQPFEMGTKATSEKSKASDKYTPNQVTEETCSVSPFNNAATPKDTSHDPPNSTSHKVKKQKENAIFYNNLTTELDLTKDHIDQELSSSFSKLKISESNGDGLKFPVEETTQGEHELYTGNHHVHISDPNNTDKECLQSAGSMAPSGKSTEDECTDSNGKQLPMERSSESFIYIKEPPHSVYIPPSSLENHPPCSTLIDCHWKDSGSKQNKTPLESSQSPSLTATFETDDSLYIMEETQEKFIVISKQTNPKD
ncbi:uncharacterized protein LOC115469856 [Microcaecilia unicolor]|uniref:Uncharacterized protein LOC115469856 n=1 Tax=Microcaecilia unicolor TaxID=1415580 RepID=A0A6P7Y6S0_9AMPH|nr:uncharacterized protein LOC115469856 [Microcaecilia unicolor]